MRQDQEALRVQARDDRVRHRVRLEYRAGRGDRERRRLAGLDTGHQHVGAHAERAERADADPAAAVGQRQPLGEGHRGVLGRGVRRVAGRAEQPRRRAGVEQVAAAAVQHPGQHGLGGIDVREHVDRPGP